MNIYCGVCHNMEVEIGEGIFRCPYCDKDEVKQAQEQYRAIQKMMGYMER